MPFQKVSLCDLMFVSLYIVHASATSCTLHFTWLLCEVTGIARYIPLCHPPLYESVK